METDVEPEIRQKSRINGWDCPSHILQVLAWLLVFYLAILEFALVVPSFDSIITRLSLYGVSCPRSLQYKLTVPSYDDIYVYAMTKGRVKRYNLQLP